MQTNKEEIMTIKDSGTRRQFDSGAVRDMQEGKGRCDLLPACAILRVARHFEAGAKKYDDRNWEKGIPVGSFIDSAIRHLMKYLDGQVDEDHLCAAGWNILCAMWTEEKRPDLINIPTRPEYNVVFSKDFVVSSKTVTKEKITAEHLKEITGTTSTLMDNLLKTNTTAQKAYEAVSEPIRKQEEREQREKEREEQAREYLKLAYQAQPEED